MAFQTAHELRASLHNPCKASRHAAVQIDRQQRPGRLRSSPHSRCCVGSTPLRGWHLSATARFILARLSPSRIQTSVRSSSSLARSGRPIICVGLSSAWHHHTSYHMCWRRYQRARSRAPHSYLCRAQSGLIFRSELREIGREIVFFMVPSPVEIGRLSIDLGEHVFACRSMPNSRRNRFNRVNLFAAIDHSSSRGSDLTIVMSAKVRLHHRCRNFVVSGFRAGARTYGLCKRRVLAEAAVQSPLGERPNLGR